MNNNLFGKLYADISHPIERLCMPFLRFYRIRYWFVNIRFMILKNKMQFGDHKNKQIGTNTVSHNLSAFKRPRAAFGCGNRMELLIYPILAYFVKNREKIKILVVGCRSEDDIYWLRSYRFTDTYGFDLFSYSDNILIGDIHKTTFADQTYDVVLLAWMIAYSTDPMAVIKECKRILKPGGLIGIGLDAVPDKTLDMGRYNNLNSTSDILHLLNQNLNHKVVFEYDHYNKSDNRSVVISKIIP